MDAPYDSEVCVVCRNVNEVKLVQVGEGLSTLLQYCHSRCKSALGSCLESRKGRTRDLKELVHENYRQDFTNVLRTDIFEVRAIIHHGPLCRVTKFLYTLSVCSNFMNIFE